MEKYYLNDLLTGVACFDINNLNTDKWKQDNNYEWFTTDSDTVKWFETYNRGVNIANRLQFDTFDLEYYDYIDIAENGAENITDTLTNILGYDYVTDFGDFDLYVRKNNDKYNQFYDVFINYHENVGKQGEAILVEKNDFTSIERALQEIDADETSNEGARAYVIELLGLQKGR